MTRRTDFTTEQWSTLLTAIPLAARAVAAAAGASRQTEDELHEFVDLVQDAANDDAGDQLVSDLVTDIHGFLASGGLPPPDDPETAYATTLEAMRKAGAILAVVADPVQADSVRAWFSRAMWRVAAAAKEGGVLGIGAEAISPGETVVMSELADAFGADPELGRPSGTT
jgi:hypothetical protein